MNSKLKDGIMNHIKSNMALYFLVLAFFAIGVAAGAFTVRTLDDTQNQDLVKYIQNFFQVLDTSNVDSFTILMQSINTNIQTILVVWILGIAVIGIPVTLVVVGIRGFILGFTVGFLINSLGWKGVLFTLAAIIPQNIIIISIIMVISVLSLNFSIMIIKNRLAKRITNNYWQKLLSYTIITVVLFIFSLLGSLVEAYISPELIKLMSSYLVS